MTTYTTGNTATLTVQWNEYAGGPAIDVSDLTVTIKTSGGTTVVAATSTGVTKLSTGLYSYEWAIDDDQDAGDYSVIWDATDGDGDAVQTSEVVTVVTANAVVVPTVAAFRTYLRGDASSFTDNDLLDALTVEAAAQAAACYIPDTYPDDLRGALLRRAQRNLAMRMLPLAIQQGDAEVGVTLAPPGTDPEVRRLERPYRKLLVG